MAAKLHFVSAGAGSGKTYRLTQILHEKLASGGIRPSGVIATTFTKKAAAELRERVRSHLLKQGDYGLANAMGQARIGTVNSVCGALLERFAFEAGLATEQQVLEEGQAAVLIKHAIDAVMDGPEVAGFQVVVNRLGIEEWQNELKALVDKARANDIDPSLLSGFADENAADLLQYFPKPTKDNLSGKLLKAISAALPPLTAISEGGKKNTNDYLSLVRNMERGVKGGYAPWSDWVKLSKTFPEVSAHGVAEKINDLAARYAEHSDLHADITIYLKRMFTLCGEVLKIYADQKREMGVLDFTDQEHLLLKVLDDPAVASTLTQELDLLLVDEFQDTSPIQLALFLKLAGYAREIYWVGDIKQAIYGFRGSDTELMEAILRALPALGGDKEILGSSWRSRPPLVRLVNEVFIKAFENTLESDEVELKAERKDVLKGAAIGNWILGGKNKGQEISSLAAGILRLIGSRQAIFDKDAKISRPVRYGDIAILARKNDDVILIASELRAFGIPSATSQPGLLSTPEGVLSMACLRRLNDKSDTIATAEILAMADCVEPESWLLDRLSYLASDGDRDLWKEQGDQAHPLLATLATMRTGLPLLSPREALQAVITQCDLPSRILRWKQDASVARVRLANLEAMLDLAKKYEEVCFSRQHAASISGLILWVNEQADDEQDSLAEPAIDAVKIMTHHAAKGLEWPVVILMDLHAKVKDRLWAITASSRESIDIGNPLKDRFIRYWPWPFGKQGKVSVVDEIALSDVAKAFHNSAIEESKRLLYVSMTRARDLLILARSRRKLSGEWLDTLGAPWLLPVAEDVPLNLPSGESIDGLYWALDPLELEGVSKTKSQPIYWYRTPETSSIKLPLIFNPSSASPVESRVVEQVRIGERIGVASKTDMTQLGTAIHGCIAASFTDQNAFLSVEEINDILVGFGVGDKVSPQAVFGQIEALRQWVTERWPEARAFTEIPVESVLETGQIMQGRIDFLLETTQGWVLIDHKSNPQGIEKWEAVAQEYAGQLDAYKGAIEKATGKPVVENWLFFPVSAGAVKVESNV